MKHNFTFKFKRQTARQYAQFLSLSYLFISMLYILFSTKIAEKIATNVEDLAMVETYKGLAFMLTSSVLLYFFSLGLLERLERSLNELTQSRVILSRSELKALGGALASSIAYDSNRVLGTLALRVDSIKQSIQRANRGDEFQTPFLEQEDFNQLLRDLFVIEASTEKLTQLIKEIKAQGLRSALEKKEEREINFIVGEVLDLVWRQEMGEYCDVKLNLWSKPINATVQPQLFSQMILNLLINASEACTASPNRGKIEVVTGCLPDQNLYFIEVHDNGPGVNESLKEEIFKPFFTTKNTASGLGLLSVKSCIEEHQGQIIIARSYLGGACFRVELPIIQSEISGYREGASL